MDNNETHLSNAFHVRAGWLLLCVDACCAAVVAWLLLCVTACCAAVVVWLLLWWRVPCCCGCVAAAVVACAMPL
jgi:hypothetical protein